MRNIYPFILFLGILFSIVPSKAQISLTTANGSFSEDFDIMGSTGTTLPTGWTAIRLSGSGTVNAPLTPSVTNGGANAGNVYNVGTSNTSDRALGTIASGSTVPAFGVAFTNNTGSFISNFSINGVSEQWRTGSNTVVESVIFEYSTDATSLNTGTWTAVNSLNLVEILTANNTNVAVDGNAPSNRTNISGNISSVNLPNGATIWIRWRDTDNAGSDGLYALDNFQLSWTNSAVVNSVSIAAGTNAAEPATNGSFFINLNNPAPAGGLSVTYNLSGTATTGTDYSHPQNGTVVIPEGSTSANLIINVLDDTEIESTEIITATITSVSGSFTIGTPSSATITISDNDNTAIYAYDFATCSGVLSHGFTQQSIRGSAIWGCTEFGQQGAGVQMNGFVGGSSQVNEDWLISPPVNLTSTTVPLLSFYSRTRFQGDSLKLYITTNYTGDVTTTSWTELDGKFPALLSDTWKLSDNINLSAFKAANVRFAFRYTSTSMAAARWTLDEIYIRDTTAAPAPDISINTALMDFRQVASGNTSTSKAFSFWANNLTSPVTFTAPAGFEVSKDGSTFSTAITYSAEEVLNQQKTAFVRFKPTSDYKVYSGMLQLSGTGINEERILLKGNSWPMESTLNVVNWNLEWFGSSQGPADDDLQQANAKKVIEYLNPDVLAMAEIVDTVRFGNLVRSLAGGYNYVVSDYASGSYASGQKLALVYKTSVLSNVKARGLMQSSPTAFSNWSSGRVPFLVNADVTKNGRTANIDFIVVHAKANTGNTAEQIDSYNRRKAGVIELKDTLDTHFATARIMILGDFNDDLDRTIAPTTGADTVSSYQVLVADSTDANHYKSITLPLSLLKLSSTAGHPDIIDHVVISDELASLYLNMSASLFNDIGQQAGIAEYAQTTSDHYTIQTRFLWEGQNITLPVTLTGFIAEKHGNTVHLSWTTSQESNVSEFIIERSPNGQQFQPIGKVAAAGNASQKKNYKYVDVNPAEGTNYYRLKIIDTDGTTEVSKVTSIAFSRNFNFSLAPNPAKNKLTLTVTDNNSPITLQIVSLSGKILMQQLIQNQVNPLEISHLNKGVYLLRLTKDGSTYTEKLLIQ